MQAEPDPEGERQAPRREHEDRQVPGPQQLDHHHAATHEPRQKPDISECEGLEDVPLPQPVDDLDDVEVLVTVITEEDICAALEDVEEAPTPPSDGSTVTDDLDELLEDLFDVRTRADRPPTSSTTSPASVPSWTPSSPTTPTRAS